MEANENTGETPAQDQLQPAAPTPIPGGCYIFNLILNIIIALSFGVGIVLILNILNRGGWFALLSGLFGTMLYIALVFPRLIFGPAFIPPLQRQEVINAQRQRRDIEGQGRATTARINQGIFLVAVIGIAAFIGLYFLPDHGSMYALLSAILSMLICISGFMLGLGILVLFFSHRRQIERNRDYVDL